MAVEIDPNALRLPVSAGAPSPGGRRVVLAWAKYRFDDWSTWFLLFNGVLLALYLVWLPFRSEVTSDPSATGQLAGVLQGLALELQLVLALVAWRASTSARIMPRRRLGWRLFALACLAYWVGNLVYFYYETILKVAPFPSLADAGYLAFYPLAFGGLLCLTGKPGSKTDRAQFWLDAITVVVGIGTLVWYFLLHPLAGAHYNNVLELVLTLAYPVGDTLLMFGVTVILMRQPSGESSKPLAWLVAGMMVHFFADTSFAYQSLQGSYVTGGLNGGLYNTAYFLMLVAAHLEYRNPGQTDVQETAGRPARSLIALPYMAVAVAYGLLFYVSRGEWSTPMGGLIVAVMTLTALMTARQLLSARENARLRGVQAARESEARFSSMVRHSSDVLSLLAPDQTIRFISPSALRVYGYAPEVLHYTSILNLLHPEDRPRAQSFLLDALTRGTGMSAATEWRLLHSDGGWRDIETIATNLTDDPAVGGLVLNSRDVTERKLLGEQLRELAFHDPLTRLANRTLLRDRVEHALLRMSRKEGKVTVLFLDLDNFKTINDSIGHAEGDVLLKETAARLLGCSRPQDTVARLGGDEFAILVEDPMELDVAVKLAERIAAAFAQPLLLGGREVGITASIGIAQGSGDDDVDALLRNADVAMYAVKNRGKRGYAVFEPGMHAAVVERLDLEADFSKALEREELRLLYQPVVELKTGRYAGVEALVRWHHPQRGVVPPSLFIPLAEENSELIVAVGLWVLREACRQGKIWQDMCPPGQHFHVAVNISVRQLQHSNLARDVAGALADFKLDPRALVLEITEGTLMQRTDLMLRTLHDLRASGVRLAIDDFGMGYSSLSYLNRFPVDILKIDKSFIDHLGQGVEGGGLTPAIIALADTMRLQTIAEGVETAEQAHELVRLGCQLAQGYYFALPSTPEKVEEQWIAKLEGRPEG